MRWSSPGNSEPPPTSWSKTTCGPGLAHSSMRWPPGMLTSTCCSHPRRSRARPSTARSPQEGLACDVASGGELALALKRGLRARPHVPARQRQVRRRAARRVASRRRPRGDRFAARARATRASRGELGRRQEVLIRVTPDVAGDTHSKISTGQADSKFGFSIEQARGAIERLRDSRALQLVGLHLPHRFATARARAVPGGGQRDRPARGVRRLQPRRRAGGRLHDRSASAELPSSTSMRSSVRCTTRSAPTSGSCSSPAARWWPTRP